MGFSSTQVQRSCAVCCCGVWPPSTVVSYRQSFPLRVQSRLRHVFMLSSGFFCWCHVLWSFHLRSQFVLTCDISLIRNLFGSTVQGCPESCKKLRQSIRAHHSDTSTLYTTAHTECGLRVQLTSDAMEHSMLVTEEVELHGRRCCIRRC